MLVAQSVKSQKLEVIRDAGAEMLFGHKLIKFLVIVVALGVLNGCSSFPIGSGIFSEGLLGPLRKSGPAVQSSALRQYKVGPGDELIVALKGTDTRLGLITVSESGRATLPRKGEMHVAGMSLSEIGHLIEANDGRGVLVELKNPYDVYIIGAVSNPGAVQFHGELTLQEGINSVGGASHKADLRRVRIKPQHSGEESDTVFDPSMRLLPGDIIRIEERYF